MRSGVDVAGEPADLGAGGGRAGCSGSVWGSGARRVGVLGGSFLSVLTLQRDTTRAVYDNDMGHVV